jgi:hypothetical protein
MKTSLISILSSTHGRLRREERDIEKRDLQKALKYGTVSECKYKDRLRVEYDGIVFIVDKSMRREITSFPSPLQKAQVDEKVIKKHEQAKAILELKPELCKSHTVLVVDNSGSMQTHDIPHHRDRQVAAYATLALEYVAEQLFKQTANDTDVVSLVEFNERAHVVFSREPCSWLLYNKLLSRREHRDFAKREDIRNREALRADSNYLPALWKASELLELDRHDGCALAVFFLSDGEPSDARRHEWTPLHTRNQICNTASQIASKYGKYLTMSFVGFGNASGDFSILQTMADSCNNATGTTQAEFVYCDKMARSVGTALTSLATSLTEIRTSLMGRAERSSGPKRAVVFEKDVGQKGAGLWRFYQILDHRVYNPNTRGMKKLPWLPPGSLGENESIYDLDLQHYNAPFLAMNINSCGYGAERIAFRSYMSEEASPYAFTLGAMVAKETNSVHRMVENEEFHRSFCETQGIASYLAGVFNQRVCSAPSYCQDTTPVVSFLDCSVLVLKDHTVSGGKKDVLVEKMLDTKRFKWSKWNDNGGGVEGQAFHAPLNIEYELKLLGMSNGKLEGVEEEDSEEESEGPSEDDSSEEEPSNSGPDSEDSNADASITPSDYLQAFSHFSYVYTGKALLVCDLQGIFNTETVPPKFELTDPAIHSVSGSSGRRLYFGPTDKGRKGMQQFLNTHKCSSICHSVNLSKSNPYWYRDFRKNHNQKFSG